MNIKPFLILFLTIFLISCSDKKLIKYEFKNSEIELNWFHYSYISNTSSDFIEIKCGNSSINIFESQYGLQEVKVENKKIIISHLKFNGVNPKLKRTENVCGYEIEYKEVNSHKMYLKHQKTKNDSIIKPIVELNNFINGRWISETDSLSGIEIINDKWIMFYKGLKTDSTDIYKYKISQGTSNFADSQPNTGKFLTLTNSSDTLNYEILRYDVEYLNLIYLPRGNILIYKSKK